MKWAPHLKLAYWIDNMNDLAIIKVMLCRSSYWLINQYCSVNFALNKKKNIEINVIKKSMFENKSWSRIQYQHRENMCVHISHLCLGTRPFSYWGGNLVSLCLKAGTSSCCLYLLAAGKSSGFIPHPSEWKKKTKTTKQNKTNPDQVKTAASVFQRKCTALIASY